MRRHSSNVGPRRNDPPPADARTRVPSCGHARQGHDAPMQQRRDRLRDERIQVGLMLDPEITQRVIADRHAAAQPAVGIMRSAQTIDLPGAPDAVDRRIEPQRQQQLRIDRRPPRMPFARLDARVEGRQIQPLHKLPDEPRRVAGRERAAPGRTGTTRIACDSGSHTAGPPPRIARGSADSADPDQATAIRSCGEGSTAPRPTQSVFWQDVRFIHRLSGLPVPFTVESPSPPPAEV